MQTIGQVRGVSDGSSPPAASSAVGRLERGEMRDIQGVRDVSTEHGNSWGVLKVDAVDVPYLLATHRTQAAHVNLVGAVAFHEFSVKQAPREGEREAGVTRHCRKECDHKEDTRFLLVRSGTWRSPLMPPGK